MVSVIILAGGQGSRMRLPGPKVLQRLGGQTLIESVMQTALTVRPSALVIVGSRNLFADPLWPILLAKWNAAGGRPICVEQPIARGTGDAARIGLEALPFGEANDSVFICYGDMPLVQPHTLAVLQATEADLALGAFALSDPANCDYGRVLCDPTGAPAAIKETRGLAPAERTKLEVGNAGVYCVRRGVLTTCLAALSDRNAAGELYLTDIVQEARAKGGRTACVLLDPDEACGMNTPEDLLRAPVQHVLRRRALAAGGILEHADSVIFSMDTAIASGAIIGPFVTLGPGVRIEKGARILPFCCLESCVVGAGATVGPFAHIKMDSVLGEGAVVGNFVEVKHSTLGAQTKAKHLAYIGDATLCARVNVGAGTVFCNYDGFRKHPTLVGAGAQIGANTSLVAPLEVGEGSVIGAGSVVTRDVAPDALALARPRLVEKAGWAKRRCVDACKK